MNGWNEDNFLEKMMPLVEKSYGGAADCPTVEILGAAADGSAPDAVRAAVSNHTAHCVRCADLLARLSEFHHGTAATESEWRDTQKRLDARMRDFLTAGQPACEPMRTRSPWWDLSWMLVPIALAVVLMVWMPKVTYRRPPAVASVKSPAAAAQDKPSPGIASLAAAKDRPETPPPANATPAPAASDPTPEPEQTAAAQPPENPPAAEPEPAAAPRPAESSSPAFAPVVATAAGQNTPSRQAPPQESAPAWVRLNAGTRVWILLQSTSPESNGGFTFRGVVLLPVTQGGTVLLDRETRVVGAGRVDQGRTTIRIAEFEWQGTRYRLRGGPVAARSPQPGSGPVVTFNAGQVLETWLASPSIYEKVRGGRVPEG
jgi:hypothetical protein